MCENDSQRIYFVNGKRFFNPAESPQRALAGLTLTKILIILRQG
jgi:hypothetical protein